MAAEKGGVMGAVVTEEAMEEGVMAEAEMVVAEMVAAAKEVETEVAMEAVTVEEVTVVAMVVAGTAEEVRVGVETEEEAMVEGKAVVVTEVAVKGGVAMVRGQAGLSVMVQQ